MSPKLQETDFIRIREAPVPEKAQVFFLSTVDDARLRVAKFPVENAKGTILLLTGWSEFIEKYMEVISDLNKRGFNVAMMDWRGQGLSSRMLPALPEKGHILSFGTHIGDLRFVIEHFLQTEFPAGPYYLMAHSMGGCVSLLHLAEGEDLFEKAVLCSPMTRIIANPIQRGLTNAYSKLTITLGLERKPVPFIKEYSREFEGNVLTHDRKRHTMYLRLMETAPNAALHGPTYGWVNAALNATKRLNSAHELDSIKIPVRIIYAGADQTVDGGNTRRLAAVYDQLDPVRIEGAYHELLMEADQYREQFWNAFDEFINGKVTG